jgi:DNA-binding NarL/FixJ family response regulator
MASFDQNPHYVRYVQLLKRLHETVLAGEGESVEADELREQMDAPWSHLSEEEVAEIDKSYSAPSDPQEDAGVPLTAKESEVLRHLASGLTNEEIARTLQISDGTVRTHVQQILRKIGASDRVQAAVWAVRKQMV